MITKFLANKLRCGIREKEGKFYRDLGETIEEIDLDLYSEEINNLIKEYNNTEYQRLRAIEYNKLNQDEMRFDDEINGTTTWIDTILAIKEKYPKPEIV